MTYTGERVPESGLHLYRFKVQWEPMHALGLACSLAGWAALLTAARRIGGDCESRVDREFRRWLDLFLTPTRFRVEP